MRTLNPQLRGRRRNLFCMCMGYVGVAAMDASHNGTLIMKSAGLNIIEGGVSKTSDALEKSQHV